MPRWPGCEEPLTRRAAEGTGEPWNAFSHPIEQTPIQAMFQSVGGCEAVPSMVNMVLRMSLLTSWAISRVPCGWCPSARSAWGQSGKHMLAVRFTRFDPTSTCIVATKARVRRYSLRLS